MDEEHLEKTGVGADGCSAKPENGQHLGQSGEGKNQVDKGEHGKKEKHGLVKAAFHSNKKEQNTIPSHWQEEHEAKRKWDPNVCSSQSWNASQEETMWKKIRSIGKNHGDHLTQKSKEPLQKKKKK